MSGFVYVRPYQEQQSGDRTEEQQLDSILVPLEGAGGAEVLRSNGCNELAEFYNMLHESFQRDILAAMAAMHQDDIYIYLINDRSGLSDEVRELVGVSTYNRPQTVRPQSVWLCGRPAPERAIWIGERFIGDYRQAFMGLPGTVVPNSGMNSGMAVRGAFLGEMIHAISGRGGRDSVSEPASWQPNDLIISPSSEAPRRTMELHFTMTMMATELGAARRGLELFVAQEGCTSFFGIYSHFFDNNALFLYTENSQVRRALGGDGDYPQPTPDTVGFFWRSIPMDRMILNEVYLALFLREFARTQPRTPGSGGTELSGFNLVLDIVRSRGQVEPGLRGLIGEMLTRYESSAGSQEQIHNRRLYYLALVDTLTNFTGNREAFAELPFAEETGDEQIEALLTEYFGEGEGSGLRATIRQELEAERPTSRYISTLGNFVSHLQARFNQNLR